MRVVTHGEEETVELGRQLARHVSPPRAILLMGELGAGKTALARGIASGLAVSRDTPVTSPTFSLVHQYATPNGVLLHLDLYRLNTLRDFYSIGIEEILAGDSIVLIEWAEKLPLPVHHPLKIRISMGAAPEERIFDIDADEDPGLSVSSRLRR